MGVNWLGSKVKLQQMVEMRDTHVRNQGDSIKEQQLIVVLSSLFLRQLRQMDWFSGENRSSISGRIMTI
jgi:hypothetical protein